MKALNPHTLPLLGRQVIEASAGTGKTWTLAALYLRLVLGHERTEALLPPQILVMTFTDAATAELRERIRTRLSQAATYFDLSAQGRPLPERLKVDVFLVELRDSFDDTLWPRCALQLNCAAEWMDDAAIYTIHGWSRRMLTQHALESQNLFEQTRLENAAELKLTLVQDYWRAWFYPLPADTLQHIAPLIGQDPSQLLKTLSDMWREQERTPSAVAEPATNPSAAVAAHMAWQAQVEATAEAARHAWSDAVLQALQDAGAQKKIKGLRADYFANWLKVLQAWATQDEKTSIEKADRKVLERFTTQALQDKGWAEAEGFAFFAAVADHIQTLGAEPSTTKLIALHAAHAVGEAYKAAKTQRAAFDFSDLLQNLHHAVMADDGRLANAIRLQYPVALVDEFQDTDPWQYGTLNRIYTPDACTDANHHQLSWRRVGHVLASARRCTNPHGRWAKTRRHTAHPHWQPPLQRGLGQSGEPCVHANRTTVCIGTRQDCVCRSVGTRPASTACGQRRRTTPVHRVADAPRRRQRHRVDQPLFATHRSRVCRPNGEPAERTSSHARRHGRAGAQPSASRRRAWRPACASHSQCVFV